MTIPKYPKRLIEVDLPIARISAHARREKALNHGHISSLHIWWARRPLAACRSVICASLWPDPVDLTEWAKRGEEVQVGDTVIRPGRFLDAARERMSAWGKDHLRKVGPESYTNFVAIQQGSNLLADPAFLRRVLLDFIADFANWDNSTDKEYVATARALTEAAHEALGGELGTRPLVVDPFAGGGAIPLEALRVGADTFASDLNPVAVLLERVILEYVPKHGKRLTDEVRKWGDWVKKEAERELADFYPADPDGARPVAYLWARTIRCEGPGCGVEVPLLGSFWLSKRDVNKCAINLKTAGPGRPIQIELAHNPTSVDKALTSGNSATCPACGFTTPVAKVREQLKSRRGGSGDAVLLAIATQRPNGTGKRFRLPTVRDQNVVAAAAKALEELEATTIESLPLVPNEQCPPDGALGFRFQKYGITNWRDLYTPRQLLTLCTFSRIVADDKLHDLIRRDSDDEFAFVVQTILALAVGRLNDRLCTLCRWRPDKNYVEAANGGQNKMPMLLDFAESTPFGGRNGDWLDHIDWITRVMEHLTESNLHEGGVEQRAAQHPILPDDSADALITDPPYFNAFGYGDLSEFFFIWLRRAVPKRRIDLQSKGVPKLEEAISIGMELPDGRGMKGVSTYTEEMARSFSAARETLAPDGIGVVVFANKTTAGWEAILEALTKSGWIASASWPIDTELASRQRALGSAALNSSVHIVCRPRENPDGSVITDEIGDWRDVLQELPRRIHEWMPRLAEEGVVGADAIFACLGPALEIFSRYSRVEKTSGDVVPLREYLEQVWAAVSKEALSMIFRDPDTAGLEPDARLTAMWLWTLGAGTAGGAANSGASDEYDAEVDEENGAKSAKAAGFTLEYDAARKIAQGLGAHLEKAPSIVEVKGDTARLLSVTERTRYLLGKDAKDGADLGKRPRKKQPAQRSLFDELAAVEEDAAGAGVITVREIQAGATVLDRVHQAMILFGAGRGEALKRFLVEEGVGKDARFWKLAQALSALYPNGGDEKRWVDGVLARKKGLGL